MIVIPNINRGSVIPFELIEHNRVKGALSIAEQLGACETKDLLPWICADDAERTIIMNNGYVGFVSSARLQELVS